MLEDKGQLSKLIATVTEIFNAEGNVRIAQLIKKSEITAEQVGYDNWNGGMDIYSIYITTSVDNFVKVQEWQSEVEQSILDKAVLILRPYDHFRLGSVLIIPKSVPKIEWDKIADIFTQEQLIAEVNFLKDLMISVSTGTQNINDVNAEYQKRYSNIDKALNILGVLNPNHFTDLWQWYGKWSAGEMPRYVHRRAFIGEMYGDLIKSLHETEQSELFTISVNLSGWERIDRSVKEIKVRLKQAATEEQFQAIGLLCRDTIVSLAQEVYKIERHPILDGVQASKTDTKRMLDAYIAVEIAGGYNESLRKYARASNDLANDLTHKRNANAKDASLCASATFALVNLIGILEDRH